MSKRFSESDLEELFIDLLSKTGYSVKFGPDISPGGHNKEREYSEVVLRNRLIQRLQIINPEIPQEAIDDAYRTIVKTESQDAISENHSFHNLLVNGINVQYKKKDGSIKHDKAFMVDFNNMDNNEFLAVNQFTIKD